MISVILTTSGRFNIFGTDNDAFILQGNLSREQLEELVQKAKEVMKKAS